jgi:hypothetical protein
MSTDKLTRSKIRETVEAALEEYSSIQINLSSKTAREAIAIKVTSDLIDKFDLET